MFSLLAVRTSSVKLDVTYKFHTFRPLAYSYHLNIEFGDKPQSLSHVTSVTYYTVSAESRQTTPFIHEQ